MDNDFSYAKATGHLQAFCIDAAIEIESTIRNVEMSDWAKDHLRQTAAKLRAAVDRSETMTASEEA